MKTYLRNNEIIREDELKEIVLPSVGDRFRRKNPLRSCPDVVTVKSVSRDWVLVEESEVYYTFDYLRTEFEPIPSAPVCPPDLLPLPEGAVYLGYVNEPQKSWNTKWYYSSMRNRWMERAFIYHDICNHHYATVAGDAAHRAQAWFSEDQVPAPTVTPPNPLRDKLTELRKLIDEIETLTDK